MAAILKNDWDNHLAPEFTQEYYLRLRQFLIREYKDRTVYPDMHDIFNALHFTPYQRVKAVILGQDPYHEPGQAHGLSFSVKPGVSLPPSLKNIFKELQDDLGCLPPAHGCLTAWAEQGVLLLNATLTVERGRANSHQNAGWRFFTDRVISVLNEREEPVVFILWGKNARAKKALITGARHAVIESAHPSPLSAAY
ncbi:MAG: uracil-DNA glycosylase, partial [Gracilibacteraceae bacterium]|nr:uracil-DNA glycosylase [Gracilibacteraceae bacterium]